MEVGGFMWGPQWPGKEADMVREVYVLYVTVPWRLQ